MDDLILYVTTNWVELTGALALFILFFDRIAKLTPTEADNKIVRYAYKIFAVLGIKVPDIK